MLQTVSDNAQRERFGCGQGLFAGPAIDSDAGQRRNIGDPTSVVFPGELDFEVKSLSWGGLFHRFKIECNSYNRTMEAKSMESSHLEKATFAAGCFWGVEATYRRLAGVKSTQVGYIGGLMENPTYHEVCTDRTGHAEALEVTFDPKVVSYHDLLEVFWNNHNPTTLNRQGPDVGSQYRSAIFYHSPEQEAEAKRSKSEAQERFSRPIVTEIKAAETFWRAEEYHQQYLEKRGLASCHI